MGKGAQRQENKELLVGFAFNSPPFCREIKGCVCPHTQTQMPMAVPGSPKAPHPFPWGHSDSARSIFPSALSAKPYSKYPHHSPFVLSSKSQAITFLPLCLAHLPTHFYQFIQTKTKNPLWLPSLKFSRGSPSPKAKVQAVLLGMPGRSPAPSLSVCPLQLQ